MCKREFQQSKQGDKLKHCMYGKSVKKPFVTPEETACNLMDSLQ